VARKPKPRQNEDQLPERGGRPIDLDSNAFALICEELARTGSKYKSCEALNFSYNSVSSAIKRQELAGDDSWRELWDSSYDQFRDGLEQEAYRRARDGFITKWQLNKKGERVPVEMEYSDRLMEVLIKGHFPDRYRDKLFVSGTIGLEPVDAFANLSPKAKRQIREIIMADLEEQRTLAAARADHKAGRLVEGEVLDVTAAIADMRTIAEPEENKDA
jgi:hypothetical protein